jgi:hypothetical protein
LLASAVPGVPEQAPAADMDRIFFVVFFASVRRSIPKC